ncbi:hypothetical protein [Streptomyces sp. NPDC014734]|uniref:hypothetical protein n=1 Tax=Streptomyces sp. NPDC014734 TaxID=3364886 RepID=UPI0036F895AB
MRRGVRMWLVAGWLVLLMGGWAATRWLGEPSATDGRPVPGAEWIPNPDAEPGPQPEHEGR